MSEFSEEKEVFEPKFERLCALLEGSRKTAVFTGAGVSTPSGIPDFRGPHGVYTDPWHGMDVEDIISLTFFRRSPDIFYKWAKDVWFRLEEYEPNVVHRVLARLEQNGMVKALYTQNIDMLHQRAGSKNVYEVHGSPEHNHCTKCGKDYPYREVAKAVLEDRLPRCTVCGGVIKPDIIFYEESLDGDILNRAWKDFSETDLCLVLGSSLTVQPAAGFPVLAVRNGADLVIVNAQPTPMDGYAALKFTDLCQVFEALEARLDAGSLKK